MTPEDLIRQLAEDSDRLHEEQSSRLAEEAEEMLETISTPWMTKIRLVRKAVEELNQGGEEENQDGSSSV